MTGLSFVYGFADVSLFWCSDAPSLYTLWRPVWSLPIIAYSLGWKFCISFNNSAFLFSRSLKVTAFSCCWLIFSHGQYRVLQEIADSLVSAVVVMMKCVVNRVVNDGFVRRGWGQLLHFLHVYSGLARKGQ